MQITVNGKSIEFSGSIIDYGTVLAYADEPAGASVTYRGPKDGDGQRSGILHAQSQPIVVQDGMVFNAIRTGNA